MLLATVSIYLIFLALFVFLIVEKIRKFGILHFPVYAFTFLAVFHLLVPIILQIDSERLFEVLGRRFPVRLSTEQLFLNLIFVLMAALAFTGGWRLAGNVPILFSNRMNSYPMGMRRERFIAWLPWMFLTVGALGFYLYFSAFGGIVSALAVARQFRTGFYEIDNPFTFMRPVGDFVKISAALFFAFYLVDKKNLGVLFGLILALVLSFLMLLFQGGRLSIAMFTRVLLLIWWSRNSRASLSVVGGIALLMSVILYFGYELLFSVYGYFGAELGAMPNRQDELGVLEFVVYELSFPSLSLVIAFDAVLSGDVSLRYGIDALIGLTSIIPDRFWSIDVARIGPVHTALANPAGMGSIPIDMLTYGVYSFGIGVGPAVSAFALGMVTRLVFRHISRLPWPSVRAVFHLLFLAQFSRALAYFDPALSINSMYYLLIGLSVAYLAACFRFRAAPASSYRRVHGPMASSARRLG